MYCAGDAIHCTSSSTEERDLHDYSASVYFCIYSGYKYTCIQEERLSSLGY